MSIRVAMVADHPGPNSANDGGVQAVSSYLVDAMRHIPGIELHVLRLKLGIDRESEIEGHGYVLHTIPIARFGTMTGFWKDQSALNRRLADIRPDVVHSQGAGHHGILAKRTSYPTVVTIHGILSQEVEFQQGLERRMRTRLQGWMGDYYCIRRASHTILISPYVAEHYGASLSGEKYLIPNPVDAQFFDVVRDDRSSKVLFAGRLNARKGVKDLVRAVAKLGRNNDLQLVLAGSTSDKRYVDELKLEVSRLKLEKVVIFRGNLRSEELLNELSECAFLVLPSYQETAPMVIQEAMAAGVPVISSNICGVPYQVDDGRTGFLFHPGDVDMLANRLNVLLSDSAMRERFGVAARVKADREYRASVVARRTVDVYEQLLG
jgi:glycosyltransferase involved in cell wall biosynthesis